MSNTGSRNTGGQPLPSPVAVPNQITVDGIVLLAVCQSFMRNYAKAGAGGRLACPMYETVQLCRAAIAKAEAANG